MPEVDEEGYMVTDPANHSLRIKARRWFRFTAARKVVEAAPTQTLQDCSFSEEMMAALRRQDELQKDVLQQARSINPRSWRFGEPLCCRPEATRACP